MKLKRPPGLRLCAVALATLVLPWPRYVEGQEVELPQHGLAVDYSLAQFDGDIDSWHLFSLEGSRRSTRGTFLLRGTLARRFSSTGSQFEAEAYPLLGSGSYAYLAAGFSPSGLFPTRRFGGELFVRVVKATEASVGVRYLDFGDLDVTLYTASLGHYRGPYFVNVRPIVSPEDGDLLLSGSLLIRRYQADPDEWLGLLVFAGETAGEESTSFDLERQKSAAATLEIRRRITSGFSLRGSGGFEWEELQPDVTRKRLTLGIGVEARI